MKNTRLIAEILLIGFSILNFSDTIFAQDSPYQRRVLIGFKKGTGREAAEKRRNWAGNLGADVHHSFEMLPLVSASLPERLIDKIRDSDDVVYIEEDVMMYALQLQPIPWGVDKIDAELVWDKSKGGNVDVAILDTGIDNDHPDLKGNIAGGVNFAGTGLKDGSTNPSYWNDGYGHGTHCAGIVAAVNNGIGVVGVAPGVRLWAVKVLSDNGSGYTSDVIQGLEWCAAKGIKVASMSLGGTTGSDSLKNACNATYSAGVLLVAAAGNGGGVNYPAAYDSVIAVSATNESDVIASFSSYGPKIELAAPGVNIYSTFNDGGYKLASGTSMACPHVAGVAALIWSVSNVNVRARLQKTAKDLGDAERDQLYGYGRVDAAKAAGVTREPSVLTTIEVLPSDVTLYVGDMQQFTAICQDQYGDSINPGTISWESTDSQTGSIGSQGLFTAMDAGETTINATGSNGVFGTASVTVKEAPFLNTIEVSPSNVSLYVGDTQQFTATCKDQYGNLINPDAITWEVTDGHGSIDSNGIFKATDAGETTIKATGSSGVSGTASVTVQEAPEQQEFNFYGSVTARGESGHTFSIEDGAVDMYVKLTWNALDDLRLRIYNPPSVMVAQVDKSTYRNRVEEITINNPVAGEWKVTAYSEGRRYSINYSIEVVVDY
jgi:subtilisin